MRAAATILGLLMLAGAALAACFGVPLAPILWLGVVGAVVVVGSAFERVRYKEFASQPPGAGWTASPERFVDPKTGRLIQVYVEATSGERRYVEIGSARDGA